MVKRPEFPPEHIQSQIISVLKNRYTIGAGQLNERRETINKVIDLINGKLPDGFLKKRELNEMGLVPVGWSNRAHTAVTAHLYDLCFPDDGDIVNITPDDETQTPYTDMMQSLITSINAASGLPQIAQTLVGNSILGEASVYCGWESDSTALFSLAAIPIKDVVLYPFDQPVSKTMKAFTDYYDTDDVIKYAAYYGWDLANTERLLATKPHNDSENQAGATNQTDQYSSGRLKIGYKIQTFFVPSLRVDDIDHSNVYAVIAEERYLLYFQPSYETENLCQYHHVFFDLRPVANLGMVNLGRGLCEAGYNIELAANAALGLCAQNIENIVNPTRLFETDGGFDPFRDAGKLVGGKKYLPISKSASPRHLQPLTDTIVTVAPSLEYVQFLQGLFNSVVGVPDFLTGSPMVSGGNKTATANRLEASGSDARIRLWGRRFVEYLLKPLIKQQYNMIATRLSHEVQQGGGALLDFAIRLHPQSAQLLAQGGADKIPKIDEIGIKIVSFQSALDKLDRISNTQQLLGTLGQVASLAPQLLQSFNIDGILKQYAKDLGQSANILDTPIPPEMPPGQEEQTEMPEPQESEAISQPLGVTQ